MDNQSTGKQNLKIIFVRDSIITTTVTIIMLSFAIDKVFQKVNGALHHFYKHRKNCNAALYKWPLKPSLSVNHVFLSVLTDLGLSPKKGFPFYCSKYATWNPTANDHSRPNWYYPPVGRSISQDGVQRSERIARADDVGVPYMESPLKGEGMQNNFNFDFYFDFRGDMLR